MDERRWLGREGEARAARHLERRGYRIVARNVRVERVEIDLIARHGATLVFVEVKSRRFRAGGRVADGAGGRIADGIGDPSGDGRHGLAAEAVDPRKQQRLRRGARAWLAAHPHEARRVARCRFDVVTCLLEQRRGSRASASDASPASIASDASVASDDGPQDDADAAPAARWSIEHWVAAF